MLICNHPTFCFPLPLPCLLALCLTSFIFICFLHPYLLQCLLFLSKRSSFEITIIIITPLLICFQGNMASEQADDLMVLNTYKLTGVLVCVVHV